MLLLFALAGCAATRPDPVAEGRCVVSVEPAMRMVTMASPAGLDGGVTSLFFPETPSVRPGDLVRVDSSPGGPSLQLLESGAESCSGVTHAAGHHH